MVSVYAEKAEGKATPCTFRQQAITWLTRQSGMAHAELQLLTGHAKRETLEIYQHIAFNSEPDARYPAAMKQVGFWNLYLQIVPTRTARCYSTALSSTS